MHTHMNNSFLCVILIFIIHTHLPDRYDWKSHCTKANLILDPSLLWKLWADLTLIEVSCSWWGAVAWDVLQMYHEWSISNYNNLWETNACSLCVYIYCLFIVYLSTVLIPDFAFCFPANIFLCLKCVYCCSSSSLRSGTNKFNYLT